MHQTVTRSPQPGGADLASEISAARTYVAIGRLDSWLLATEGLRTAWAFRECLHETSRIATACGHRLVIEDLFLALAGEERSAVRDGGARRHARQIFADLADHAGTAWRRLPGLAGIEEPGPDGVREDGAGSQAPAARAADAMNEGIALGRSRDAVAMMVLVRAHRDLGLEHPVPGLTAVGAWGAEAWRADGVALERAVLEDWGAQAVVGLNRLIGLRHRVELWIRRLGRRRTSSHAPAFVGLLAAMPVLRPVVAADVLGISVRSAGRLASEMVDLGIARPLTLRRSWSAIAAADIDGPDPQVRKPGARAAGGRAGEGGERAATHWCEERAERPAGRTDRSMDEAIDALDLPGLVNDVDRILARVKRRLDGGSGDG